MTAASKARPRAHRGKHLPQCLDKGEWDVEPDNVARRPKHLGPFILEVLYDKCEAKINELLRRWDDIPHSNDSYRDERLLQPYRAAESHPYYREELRVVKDFVQERYKEWTLRRSEEQAWVKSQKTAVTLKAKLAYRAQMTRDLADRFALGPPEDQTTEMRKMNHLQVTMASYAYSLPSKFFGYNMKFSQLCALKVGADVGLTITPEFVEWNWLSKAAKKKLGNELNAHSDVPE